MRWKTPRITGDPSLKTPGPAICPAWDSRKPALLFRTRSRPQVAPSIAPRGLSELKLV